MRNCAMAMTVAFGFTACDSDDDDNAIVADVTLNVASANLQYRPQGFWVDTYSDNELSINGFKFTHSGTEEPPYISWEGFTASKSTDNADEAGADEQQWINYQWGAMPKGGVAGVGTPYLVAFWSEWTESQNQHSLKVSRADGKSFQPLSVYLTNTAYAYWAMKKGDAFAKAFTSSDQFTVKIHGVKGETETGVVVMALANGTDIYRTWMKCDLSSLGNVDYIYFTMTTTDMTVSETGSWMNTPAYFALDRLEANVD